MFWTKWIVFALSLIMLFVARQIFEEHYSKPTILSNVFAGIAGILGIVFCVLMAVMHWNIMIIPKILLYITICVYVVFKEWDEDCEEIYIFLIATVIAFFITGIVYINRMEEANDPDVVTNSCDILCAKDGSIDSGSFSGSIIYVHGSSSGKSVYKYYYQQEDGGVKLGTISADDTTLYFLKDGEKPHLETIVTTQYYLNTNNNPPTRCFESSKITYKLYIPEGSITNVYEFDAE